MVESAYPVSSEVSESLVVDASSSNLQVGLATAEGWNRIESSAKQAMEGLYHAIGRILSNSECKMDGISVVHYCEGPGSTLGLRIAAACVRTMAWNASSRDFRLFKYNALDLAPRMVEEKVSFLQAPYRMGTRIVRIEGSNPIGRKQLFNAEQALKKFPNSHHLPDPRNHFPLPDNAVLIKYDLARVSGLSDLNPISQPCSSPLPFAPQATAFRKWNPHQSR